MRFEMTLNKRMLPAALALTLTGLHPASQAGTIGTQHGSKCKEEGESQYTQAFKGANGIWNYTNERMNISCQVIRVGPPTSGGLRVWIDGYAPFGLGWVLTCGLFSSDYTGRSIGQAWLEIPGTGSKFDRYLELVPAYVPLYSTQVVW